MQYCDCKYGLIKKNFDGKHSPFLIFIVFCLACNLLPLKWPDDNDSYKVDAFHSEDVVHRATPVL